MARKIHIDKIFDYLESYTDEVLVLGSPKGIGTSSAMAYYLTYKWFFSGSENKNFTILSITDSVNYSYFYKLLANETTYYYKEKVNYGQIGEDWLSSAYMFYEDSSYGSILASTVLNGVNIKNILSIHDFDIIYVDVPLRNNEQSLTLIEELLKNGKKIILNSYDYDDSIYYLFSENNKVILHTDYFKQKEIATDIIQKHPTMLGVERIAEGKFAG